LIAICCGVGWACDPPSGGINGIGDGTTVSGTVVLEFEVKSETEVKGVDLYVDDKLVTSLDEAPYRYELDTTTLEDGEHTAYVKIRAVDREDGVSEKISFTVNNTEGESADAGG
jgi:hypothetical protein